MKARAAILAVAAVLIAYRAALPQRVFWISDAGNKFLLAQNFVAGGFRHVAVGYPAADLDPAFRWFPAAAGHFVRSGGAFFSIVSPAFPFAAAPFPPALLPLIAGIGIAMLIPPLLRAAKSDVDPALAIIATALATPIAFYSLDFWEHTTATFFATAAVVLLLRGSPLLAGVAAGVSIVFREEGYVFAAAVLLTMFAWRFVAGLAAVVIPWWIAQFAIYGNPFGLHLASHAAAGTAGSIGRNVAYFLFQFHERPAVALLLAAPFVTAIVIGALREVRGRTAVPIACGVASAIGIALLIADRDPILNTIPTQGLFLFLPFVSLFLVRWRDAWSREPLARIAIIYIVLMPLVLRANWSGVVWGPRYFLTIVPLLVVLSLQRGRLTPALVAVSIALEVFGLVLLHRKLEATAGLASALRAAPQVVISDVYWLPEEMGALYFEKKMLQPTDDRELVIALNTLRAHGVRDVAVVLSPRYRWFSPRARTLLESLAVRRTVFAPPRVPLLRADILECRLPAQ